jgi:hypothetical protein
VLGALRSHRDEATYKLVAVAEFGWPSDLLGEMLEYMGRLRQKLEQEPTRPRHFLTEAGVGYRFVSHEQG